MGYDDIDAAQEQIYEERLKSYKQQINEAAERHNKAIEECACELALLHYVNGKVTLEDIYIKAKSRGVPIGRLTEATIEVLEKQSKSIGEMGNTDYLRKNAKQARKLEKGALEKVRSSVCNE